MTKKAAMDEAASIMALLKSRDIPVPDVAPPTEPLRDRGNGSLSLVPFSEPGPVKGVEWTLALHLVEQAATRIRTYERKFKAIEVDARAFIERVDAEQKRLNEQIRALEADLKRAEERALAAEDALNELKLETWEAKLARRSTEHKLSEAEAEIRTSQKYLGQIEDILKSL